MKKRKSAYLYTKDVYTIYLCYTHDVLCCWAHSKYTKLLPYIPCHMPISTSESPLAQFFFFCSLGTINQKQSSKIFLFPVYILYNIIFIILIWYSSYSCVSGEYQRRSRTHIRPYSISANAHPSIMLWTAKCKRTI